MAVSEVSPTTFIESLRAAGLHLAVPPHSVLFVQGDEAAGIHVLHAGQVKLSMNSSRGRTLILKVSEPGEILGLHNCLTVDGGWSGSPRLGSGQAMDDGERPSTIDHGPTTHAPGTRYEVSAESLQRCEITFVRRDDFLRLLAREPQVLLAVAGQLSRECHSAYGLIQTLATSNCISERLARLLLDLAASAETQTAEGAEDAEEIRNEEPLRPRRPLRFGVGETSRVAVGLTHEEIAQMIGTSRETVTRLLKEFRTRRVAMLKGCTLHILDKLALQQMVDHSNKPNAGLVSRWPLAVGR